VVGDVEGEGDRGGQDPRWEGAEGGERHVGLRGLEWAWTREHTGRCCVLRVSASAVS
jgi:hypothetical protein